MKSARILSMVLAVLLCAGFGIAHSQEKYPSKQITYMVTFDPGGQSDREARRQQPLLAKILGQQVVIDYKVGGGGALGWKEISRSKPDGYTMAGFNIPHVILQPMQQDVGYKTEQLVPVAIFQKTILAVAVPENSPFKTLKDLIDAAKKDPEKITVGGSSVFSGPHFATMKLEKSAGVKFTYVPFTGAAPQMTALLGGHTDAGFANSDDLVRFKDKVRILGVADPEHFFGFPNAPTLKELGYDVEVSVDRGVCVPPGTPKEIIATLEKAFLQIAKDPEIQKQMRVEGFVPMAMGHEESVAYMQRLTKMYKELADALKK